MAKRSTPSEAEAFVQQRHEARLVSKKQWEIANSDLAEADLPAPDADMKTILRFAHTFDGYESYDSNTRSCGDVAVKLRSQSACGNNWTLSDLRAALFIEQRSQNHSLYESGEEEQQALIYLRKYVLDEREVPSLALCLYLSIMES